MPRLMVLAILATPATAADWPQWLGPTRDANWTETGLLEKLPEGGMKPVWKAKLEAGYGGPAVADGKLYVMDRKSAEPNDNTPKGTLPGNERVVCLDSKTGQQLWVHEYDRAYRGVDRPLGPRTTPAIDGNRAYTLGTMGDLYCLDTATGKPLWHKYFPADYKCKPPVWGYSAHLLVHGDLVIALVGGEGHSVVAFDKTTGAEKWAYGTTADVGYSPPVIAKTKGGERLIVWLSDALCALDPATGKELWRHIHPEKGVKQMTPAVSIATPALVGDLVIVSSAYDGPLAVNAATGEIAWRSKTGYPKPPDKIATLMSTLLVRGKVVFAINANSGSIICVDAATGNERWRSDELFQGKATLFGSAFWVNAGDRAAIFTDAGDLVIAKLTAEKYEEVSRARLTEPVVADRGRKVVWAHPAFAEKAIFVRNQGEILRFSLAKG